MDIAGSTKLAVLAVLAEGVLGYPQSLYAMIGHPVSWIGRLIAIAERALNQKKRSAAARFASGAAALAILLLIAAGAARLAEAGIAALGLARPLPLLLNALAAASLIAQRSLDDHVFAVRQSLEKGIEEGREAVAKIVGRDVDTLDASSVASAAIESVAESFCDGVVAPAFWIAAFGLAGGLCHKTINTADSMIGHRTVRYAAFGFAAAKLDDLVNFAPARLSALLVAAACLLTKGASLKGALRTLWRDSSGHPSPNAGWPEAAFAGALGLRIAGPRSYEGVNVTDAPIGDGNRACAKDIERALALYRRACLVHWLALIAILLAIARF
ncbi:MAG: cobalamin biosynthesis protein CobD [Methylocapsa sp.]|nr:cobalamin biosynthesis protein CobD [Methylocapsa sp.]